MDVTRFSSSFLLCCFLAIAGCSSSGLKSAEPLTVKYNAEAASTHLSIDSVGSWYSYAEALQPNFKMTEQSALNAVVPTNLHFEEAVRNAFGASLKLAPSTSSITESFTTTLDSTGNEEKQGTQTRSRNSGDGSSITLPNTSSLLSPQKMENTEAIEEGGSSLQSISPTVDLDPFLRHSAATSLYQEVELINRYIKDAALKKDFRPYLVRMNVNLMPKARNLPYDAYINVSMFSKGQAANLPIVLPLLVSDNIEAAMQSRSNTDLLNLAFGLSLLNAGNFGSVGLDSYSEDFQSIFGRDMNSLLSVTRSSSNTLKIRLGANLSSGSVYTMIPRNHKISFVVLAPLGVETIQVISKSEFVHATTGKSLRANTANYITPKVIEVLKSAGCSSKGIDAAKNEDSGYVTSLLDSVLYSNYTQFEQKLKNCTKKKNDTLEINLIEENLHDILECEDKEELKHCLKRSLVTSQCDDCESKNLLETIKISEKRMYEPSLHRSELDLDDKFQLGQIWVSLTRINEYRNINVSDISLPPILTHAEIPDTQTVILADDGKSVTKGHINGITQFSNSSIQPLLKFDNEVIVPSSYNFDKAKGTLLFSMPSLTAIGLVKNEKLITSSNCVEVVQIQQLTRHDDVVSITSECMPIRYFLDKSQAKAKEALFKLSSSTKTIVTSDGTGSISFYVDLQQKKDTNGVSKPESEAIISIDGAEYTVDDTSPLISVKGDSVIIKNSVVVKAELKNLSENYKVVITGKDKAKTSSNTLTFPIKEVKNE